MKWFITRFIPVFVFSFGGVVAAQQKPNPFVESQKNTPSSSNEKKDEPKKGNPFTNGSGSSEKAKSEDKPSDKKDDKKVEPKKDQLKGSNPFTSGSVNSEQAKPEDKPSDKKDDKKVEPKKDQLKSSNPFTSGSVNSEKAKPKDKPSDKKDDAKNDQLKSSNPFTSGSVSSEKAKQDQKPRDKKDEPKKDQPGKKGNPFTDSKTVIPETPKNNKDVEKVLDEMIESKDPIIVPFTQLPSGHFLVKVKINETGPYQLVFDTGAPLNLLNSRVAKSAKLKSGGLSLLSGLQPEIIKSLEIGSAKAAKVPAIVMDHPTVAAISNAFESEFGKIEGIVGFPFFARFAMTVDYQKGELRLVPNGYKPGDFMNDLNGKLVQMSQNKDKPVVAPSAAWGLAVSKKADDKTDGVDVDSILENSPADKSGLKKGDRLLTIDGRWTDSVTDAFRATGFVKPGQKVVMEVLRESKVVKLSITPALGQ
jgi:hypothetical protein